ncbi:MAG: DNA methyltransferase, partial [Methanoregula sp.]
PTKLPQELVQKIIRYSSNAGDLVFDPFLGSGTVAVVAQQEGRHFLGFEVVPEYVSFAQEGLRSR